MKTIICVLTLFVSTAAFAGGPVSETLKLGWRCNVRVVSQTPSNGKFKADVLFLIGYADRADNHGPLFKKIVNAGYRVISFDYPEHGESTCWDLDTHNFSTLSDMAEDILAHDNYTSKKPLYLTGWSTGGLLAYRMAQRGYFSDRTLAGLVLLAPGLSVYKVVGDKGFVTEETLLSNPSPPHKGPIKPKTPLTAPIFASSLLTNSGLARGQGVPDVPVLMILGGDKEDLYVKTPTIKEWYQDKVAGKGYSFEARQCAGAKHEIDNEILPSGVDVGSSVRRLFVNFLKGIKLGSKTCSKLQ